MNQLHLNKQLSDAVDLFVMAKFADCFYACADVIKTAKFEPEHQHQSNEEVIEAAIALGIQALAETDNWHHVISFIIDTYGSIEICPPRIVQVCILLHAHVKEYLPCHNLVQTWLKNPQNLNHSQCSKVVRIYAHHILCPTGSYETLQEVINSCPSLSDSDRAALQKLPQARRFESPKKLPLENFKETMHPGHHSIQEISSAEEKKARFHLTDTNTKCNLNIVRNQKDKSRSTYADLPSKGVSMLTTLCKTIFVTTRTFVESQKSIGLIIMGMLAFYAIIQTQSADPVSSLGRLVILWKFFISRLKQFSFNK
ncbi:peroxisome assembly protein 26-like isoform X1 [Biomphalaria pfeifferi]|uniref:Peroxisome assembly protein 26-like isoform X1 n=1 Tax=Biomphalaria pfeifferi TaxID=112525 RepID=A0AAD8B1M2_BIOPF|nr:peroxisome assembly protein 26-like isoform X1 [Biomphalaria pfeifferi]